MATRSYGGPWTILKLAVLKDYINFYTTALKKQGFKLIYIDCFAGTGSLDTADNANALFETEPLDGSAKLALECNPAFDHYVFIEKSQARLGELRSLASGHPNTEFLLGDANEQIKQVLGKFDWRSTRAVLFLDPYGLGVHWNTLIEIAKTEAIDLWYLVNILSISRQLAKDFTKLDAEPYKAELIDRMLGEQNWREILYTNEQSDQIALFETCEPVKRREGGNPAIDEYLKERLSTCFPQVMNPKPLFDSRGHQLFSLFFCVSNSSPKALGLSIKAANHILNKH